MSMLRICVGSIVLLSILALQLPIEASFLDESAQPSSTPVIPGAGTIEYMKEVRSDGVTSETWHNVNTGDVRFDSHWDGHDSKEVILGGRSVFLEQDGTRTHWNVDGSAQTLNAGQRTRSVFDAARINLDDARLTKLGAEDIQGHHCTIVERTVRGRGAIIDRMDVDPTSRLPIQTVETIVHSDGTKHVVTITDSYGRLADPSVFNVDVRQFAPRSYGERVTV